MDLKTHFIFFKEGQFAASQYCLPTILLKSSVPAQFYLTSQVNQTLYWHLVVIEDFIFKAKIMNVKIIVFYHGNTKTFKKLVLTPPFHFRITFFLVGITGKCQRTITHLAKPFLLVKANNNQPVQMNWFLHRKAYHSWVLSMFSSSVPNQKAPNVAFPQVTGGNEFQKGVISHCIPF